MQNKPQKNNKMGFGVFALLFIGFASIGYVASLGVPASLRAEQGALYQQVESKKLLVLADVAYALEEDRQALENELYILAEEVRQFGVKEQYIVELEKYVSDLKTGRTSVEVDHVITNKINESINKASDKHKVDPYLIRGVIKRESNFKVTAVSHSGAMGLMQIMPGTAKWLNLENPWDIEQNIMAGTKYLKDQLNAFNNDYRLALAAYNAGPNAVKMYKGIPPYQETQKYVPYVLEWYNIYKAQGGQ